MCLYFVVPGLVTQVTKAKKCDGFGNGGRGKSGRMMAFRLGRLGLNPRLFKFRIAVNLSPLGARLSLITCNRMVQTLPFCFLSLFPIIKLIDCNLR